MIRIENRIMCNFLRDRAAEINNLTFFNDFLLALLFVDEEYLIWQYGLNMQMGERVFAYELYHQWRKISEQFDYHDLIINGEIRKDGSILRNAVFAEVYPDLILHEQQNNLNQQLLACEIKTSRALSNPQGRRKLKRDLIKLGNYISNLEFRHCVFVQVLNPFDEFDKLIIPYLRANQQDFKNQSRIYYVIKSNDYILYDTLENIINNEA